MRQDLDAIIRLRGRHAAALDERAAGWGMTRVANMTNGDLAKLERETVIRWDELDRIAIVNTFSPMIARRLQKRGWLVTKTHVGNDGKVRGWWFSLPMKAVTFRSASRCAARIDAGAGKPTPDA